VVPTGIFTCLLESSDNDAAFRYARLWFGYDCLVHLIKRTIDIPSQKNVIFAKDKVVQCHGDVDMKKPRDRNNSTMSGL